MKSIVLIGVEDASFSERAGIESNNMPGLTIELQPQRTQTEFNLRIWAELLEDRELAKIEGRIETDRHGHPIMSPPPAPSHGSFQTRVGRLLSELLPDGETFTECPISTADGVKAADVAWASPACLRELGNHACFPRSSEICVEIISARNTRAEMAEKMELYFDAGAKEVWLCVSSGEMSFYLGAGRKPAGASKICPNFPKRIKRRV